MDDKVCLSCKKRLVGGQLYCCPRCILKTRDAIVKGAITATTSGLAGLGLKLVVLRKI